MKHTLTKLSDTSVVVTVECSADELTTAMHTALARLGREVKVPGFRKGKAPAAVVEKHIDQNMLASEAVEYAINSALNRVIDAEDLHVLDQPKIDVTKLVPFTTLEFKAEIEVLPAIKLGNYKKLKAKKAAGTVDKAEIDQVLERIRQSFAERTAVERTARDGDEVIIGFVGRDHDGKEINGAQGKDYPLTLGSNSFIPGFEEQVVGHAAGDMFDIEVTFPKDYHADDLKNKAVTFAIDLVRVNEVSLPEVDDAFAKKAGPFDTAKELRADITRELQAQKDRESLEHFKDDLLGELVKKSTVPVPDILVHDQLTALERDLTQNLMYRGQSLDDYMQSRGYADKSALHDAELRPAAVRRVQAGLVLAELSKAEHIDVSQAELEAELAKRKEEAPKMAAQLDSPEARRDLANRVITEKTINRLVEINS